MKQPLLIVCNHWTVEVRRLAWEPVLENLVNLSDIVYKTQAKDSKEARSMRMGWSPSSCRTKDWHTHSFDNISKAVPQQWNDMQHKEQHILHSTGTGVLSLRNKIIVACHLSDSFSECISPDDVEVLPNFCSAFFLQEKAKWWSNHYIKSNPQVGGSIPSSFALLKGNPDLMR